MENRKMSIEIWGDVMCSYCYMAMQEFENALSRFAHAANLHITWRSFQIAPGLKSEPEKEFYQSLSENTGMSLSDARMASDQVTATAQRFGLTFNFDKAIPANTFMAHRFLHFAKAHNAQHAAEEKLFRAYFTEGKNIDDIATLAALGSEIGLDAKEVMIALQGDQYVADVRADIDEARRTGIHSVPHYILNGKRIVSGAQSSAIFLEALEKSYGEWQSNTMSATAGSCSIDGVCK